MCQFMLPFGHIYQIAKSHLLTYMYLYLPPLFEVLCNTDDQIFTLRQIAEKYEEYGKELYVCYIDFLKAFDSVWRKGLWRVMRHYGYPEKIVRILENA